MSLGVDVAVKPHLGLNLSCAARDADSLPVCNLGSGSRVDGLNKRQFHGLVLLLHLPFIPTNRSRRSTPILAPSLVLFPPRSALAARHMLGVYFSAS